MSNLVTIRPAILRDMQWVNLYAQFEGMDLMPSSDDIYVAINPNTEPVGFVRVAEGANGAAHVNPIVVCESWRGYGVGRELMQYASDKFGELRLVARGSAVPFYQALGFETCEWDDIDMSVTEDCDHCTDRDACQPIPMKGSLAH